MDAYDICMSDINMSQLHFININFQAMADYTVEQGIYDMPLNAWTAEQVQGLIEAAGKRIEEIYHIPHDGKCLRCGGNVFRSVHGGLWACEKCNPGEGERVRVEKI